MPDPVKRQCKRRLHIGLQTGGGEIKIATPLGTGTAIVLQPGLAERCGIPMPRETGVLLAEVIKRLALHAVGVEAVFCTVEYVPLLPYNMAFHDVAAVYSDGFQPGRSPDADLFHQVLDINEWKRRAAETGDDIDSGRPVGRARVGSGRNC
jgi:hypothetical protein